VEGELPIIKNYELAGLQKKIFLMRLKTKSLRSERNYELNRAGWTWSMSAGNSRIVGCRSGTREVFSKTSLTPASGDPVDKGAFCIGGRGTKPTSRAPATRQSRYIEKKTTIKIKEEGRAFEGGGRLTSAGGERAAEIRVRGLELLLLMGR